MACLIKRNKVYYISDRLSGKIRRWSTPTGNLQLAKEKLRQYESAKAKGHENPLPTRTPIAAVVSAYVEHIRTTKTPKSAQTDIYYLREAFGPICEALKITSRRKTGRKKPAVKTDGRARPYVIEANQFEAITTTDVSTFILSQVRSRGLAPKTANRYRESSAACSTGR